eukprot:14581053-Alexandrium_andersonii.AAC.1
MSASLVGSEMCIRDRFNQSWGRTTPCSLGPSAEVGRSRPRTRPPEARPVSYTHLTLPTICSV